MVGSVDLTISDLRRAVKADNDADLARKLGVDKSTVSGWRARGRVPDEFVEFLKEPSAQQSRVWQELTDCATAVALIRYISLRHDVANSGDVDRGLSVFLTLQPWWFVIHRAAHDLRLKMDALGVDLKTAQAVIIQEDLRDPSATTSRVVQQLAEDLADNPLLLNYE